MQALILAAGYATRLYPLTEHTPKALLPIGGKAMLDYLMEALVKIPQMTAVHLVTNARFAGQFGEWAQKMEPVYGPLTPKIWDDGTHDNATRLGAIGDIQFVLDRAHIREDLLIAASDNFFTFDLNLFAQEFEKTGQDCLTAQPMEDVDTLRRFAVAALDEKGTVLDLEEKPREPKTNLAVYALYLYRADTLPLFAQYLAEGNNPDSPGHFPGWLYTKKPVHAFIFPGTCVDIGTVESYREVCEAYRRA